MSAQRIYIVDDEPSIAKLLELWVGKRWGYSVEVFANGKTFQDRFIEPPDLVLLDIMLPDINGIDLLKEIKRRNPEIPVIMLSAQESIEVALNTLKLGAADYFSKPIDLPKLEFAIKNALKLAELSREVENLQESVGVRLHFDNIVSQSGEMQDVFKLVNKVIHVDICVLILGESGTGKELIARAIHYNGERRSGPFVVVNCASIPHDLLESELFGHEKGAFTGAIQRRIGKFEQANGGTIFLDEIGELDLTLQSKILRVIQERQFDRVGGSETLTTDARLIFATHRNLWEEVKQKVFREDLYYRISTFPIMLPPLRQRKSDILILADHFLKTLGKELGKPNIQFSRKALDLLYNYPWPGNVRELENVIQRGLVLTEGQTLTERELPIFIQSYGSAETDIKQSSIFQENQGTIIPFEKIKENAVQQALKITNGNIAEAAQKLKIGRATLYRLVEKYKIKV
ncbi:MAG: sigma-54 dependent transcriptional regulator [Ignavibacteriales bacterium]|nr:sigma-54 dependent transcriptional regulator [Ignavibacteriales bacterium]